MIKSKVNRNFFLLQFDLNELKMNSLVNYSVENEYVDVANNIFSKRIPRTENENYKDIQRLRMKVNFWILIYSIIMLILVFLLGYIFSRK